MKRFLIFLVIAGLNTTGFSQETDEEEKIKQVVKTFFEGFHARDSVIMKSVFVDDPVIQTIGRTKTGEERLVTEELGKVLKGIVSIPLETDFEEVLHFIDVKSDGMMSAAWVPYSFYLNDTFSHCGVNHFQLMKKEGEWKVVYLVDTRRKQGCDLKQP